MRRMKRLLGLLTAVMALGSLLALGYLWHRQWTGNFATVMANEVYRSNQPTPERLAEYRRDYGIRAVLNLRGASPGADWYERERASAATLGLMLIDFPMSARRQLDRGKFERLFAILRDAPKPLLIHCKSGSDRTGLASVIYQALLAGVDERVAEAQLSIRYGHFSIPVLSAAWPMDETWERIEDWMDIEDS